MIGLEFYDRHGEPIDILVWASMQTDAALKSVAQMVVERGDVIVVISTVWLGLDHSFDGRRMIFETMIFGGPRDQEMRRYSSEAAAVAGHDQIVASVVEEMSVR